MEESELTVQKINDDIANKRIEILEDVKKELPKFQIYKDISDQNYHFQGYFNLRRSGLFEVTLKVEGDTTFTRTNTFIKACAEEFDSWRNSLTSSFLPEYFKKNKSDVLSDRNNLWDLRDIHLHKLQQLGEKTGLYADRELLLNPELNKLYEVIIEAHVLKDMFVKVESMNVDDPNMIDNFLNDTQDPFQELRELENKFNTASVGELINFFSVLRKEVRGQSGPIASNQDIVNLVKSILSKQVKKGSIKPNLVSSDYPAVRRLFFDFYNEFKERDKYQIEPMLRKQDYLKFIENFEPFKEATSSDSWIKDTNPKKQSTTLTELTSRRKNPLQPLLEK
ncbi:MAG: hypothetical protein ABJ004_03405 [Cyclobacteriaceae bacterium]